MTTASLSALAPTDKPARAAANRPVLIVIAVLLALLVAVAVIQLVFMFQQNSQRAERAAAAQTLVQSQQSLITNLMSDYEQAAYRDPSVETIYHQQLIASEHILGALHIMAIQNSQIVELLAGTP